MVYTLPTLNKVRVWERLVPADRGSMAVCCDDPATTRPRSAILRRTEAPVEHSIIGDAGDVNRSLSMQNDREGRRNMIEEIDLDRNGSRLRLEHLARHLEVRAEGRRDLETRDELSPQAL